MPNNNPPGLIEGRAVHYVLPEGPGVRESAVNRHLPATVVRVWSGGTCNLEVLTDRGNDFTGQHPGFEGHFWATSVTYDEETKAPGTWHYLERTD